MQKYYYQDFYVMHQETVFQKRESLIKFKQYSEQLQLPQFGFMRQYIHGQEIAQNQIRFLQKASELSNHTVKLYHYYWENNILTLIFEQLTGQTLQQKILWSKQKSTKISQDTLVPILKTLLQTFIQYHQAEIFHHNLQSQKIYIDQQGKIIIIGFSKASSIQQLPKRIKSNDIWAIGKIILDLMTLQFNQNLHRLNEYYMKTFLDQVLNLLQDYSVLFRSIVRKMLAFKSSDRISLEDALDKLEQQNQRIDLSLIEPIVQSNLFQNQRLQKQCVCCRMLKLRYTQFQCGHLVDHDCLLPIVLQEYKNSGSLLSLSCPAPGCSQIIPLISLQRIQFADHKVNFLITLENLTQKQFRCPKCETLTGKSILKIKKKSPHRNLKCQKCCITFCSFCEKFGGHGWFGKCKEFRMFRKLYE